MLFAYAIVNEGINRLDALKRFHMEYGRHSNIPECCIVFFVTEWDHESEYGQLVYKTKACRYVPCPSCFETKSFNKLRVCRKDCGRECRDDFIGGYL